MLGRAPKAIITDQCRAMAIAIEEIFPNSHHQNNDWLKSLYEQRNRWIHVYVKDKFWTGMSTSQRSESMNAFFDEYVHSKTSLKQFVEQFDNALKKKIEKEKNLDFGSFNSMIPVISGYPIERQFQSFYTNNLFKLFQDEIRGLMFCNTSLVRQEGVAFIFEVIETLLGKNGDPIRDASFRAFGVAIDSSSGFYGWHFVVELMTNLYLCLQRSFMKISGFFTATNRDGMAVARDIQGKKNRVVTIISNLTTMAGQVYEAMSNAGYLDSNMICVLELYYLGITKRIGKAVHELAAKVDEYTRVCVLNEVASLDSTGPVLVHVITEDEKDSEFTEEDRMSIKSSLGTFNDVLVEALVAEAERGKSIVVVHSGTGLDPSIKFNYKIFWFVVSYIQLNKSRKKKKAE
ncbi:hypothetical protein ZIOFF_024895 [Zingiber officinale]|uniref:Protein FAR1-RELATED SEQUENCE n=1 Tax=Zingiber officinale TaxID=94328 RepID=A0A8J5LGJ6_ZINOF|nr:hypothetical protein ZIOFF_024895 [Zingiber officinale]